MNAKPQTMKALLTRLPLCVLTVAALSARHALAGPTFEHIVDFPVGQGTLPQGALVQGGGGNFFGTMYQGGTAGYGTVFRMTPAGALTTLLNFTGNGTSNKGSLPQAGLAHGSDGTSTGRRPQAARIAMARCSK